MEKTGFYCPKCNSVPLIQIIPKTKDVKVFCCCKCNKKLINYKNFLKNYLVKNLGYENISNSPIFEESINKKYEGENQKELNFKNIKENFYKLLGEISKFFLKIKNKIVEMLENEVKEVIKSYEMNNENNIKLKNLIEILFNNYESNRENNSNIKNLIHNTKFNIGYLNEANRIVNDTSLERLLQNIKSYFGKTYIISDYNEQLYTYKKFFNHSSSVTCLVELTPEIIASSSKDTFINLYNLETKKSLYKYKAHIDGVNWLDIIYQNNIISCGEDSLIKIWPKPLSDDKIDINHESSNSVTYSKTFNIDPIFKFNISDKIIKFIIINNSYIFLCGKNKIYLTKYELITDDNNKGNLLNVNLSIVNEKDLKNNNFFDLLKIQNDKSQEFIFILGSKSLSIYSIPDLAIISEFKEFNNNSSFTCLTQLNKDEILYSNGPLIKIFNINRFQITFQYRNSKNITSLSKLKDNTFLISTQEGILRFELKHFEKISLVDLIYSNYYNYKIFPNYTHENEKISYIYEFQDGIRLGICSSYGNVKICKFILA